MSVLKNLQKNDKMIVVSPNKGFGVVIMNPKETTNCWKETYRHPPSVQERNDFRMNQQECQSEAEKKIPFSSFGFTIQHQVNNKYNFLFYPNE